MIALLILLVCVPLLFLSLHQLTKPAISASKPVEALDSTNLSHPSKAVYREYMSLPVDSRPFDDIRSILKSLDATLRHLPDFDDHWDANFENRNQGYSSERYTKYKFSWQAAVVPRGPHSNYYNPCPHKHCAYSTYYDMYLEILRVKEALDKKRLALVRSENAHNVSMADELVEALRLEAGIQKQTTLEIEGK